LIGQIVIYHIENPHRPHFDQAAGKARLFDQRQHVQRIAVVGARARNESVISG